jgi:hypothetical protein
MTKTSVHKAWFAGLRESFGVNFADFYVKMMAFSHMSDMFRSLDGVDSNWVRTNFFYRHPSNHQ